MRLFCWLLEKPGAATHLPWVKSAGAPGNLPSIAASPSLPSKPGRSLTLKIESVPLLASPFDSLKVMPLAPHV